MAESSKRSPNDGSAKAYSSPSEQYKNISRTEHLQANPYDKGAQIDEQQENTDEPMPRSTDSDDDDHHIIGKALSNSFAQANIWFTTSPDENSVIIIEFPFSIPAPATLLDKSHKPRWELIEAIPKMDPFLTKELESKSTARQKLDQDITRHLVQLKLPKTGFQSKLAEWLVANMTSHKTKKLLPVFSLANRLVRTPPKLSSRLRRDRQKLCNDKLTAGRILDHSS
jgi:hypothetical protein